MRGPLFAGMGPQALTHRHEDCMTLLILSYVGGILTILSPCVLPVLPFVFARAGRPFVSSILPMLIGMALTFALVATLAAVGGGWVVQANEYGVVPPDPVAVKVTAVPTVPVVGPPTVTARVSGLIVIVAEAVAVFAFASVIMTETVNVPFAL